MRSGGVAQHCSRVVRIFEPIQTSACGCHISMSASRRDHQLCPRLSSRPASRLPLAAWHRAGSHTVCMENATGAPAKRPAWAQCLKTRKAGDGLGRWQHHRLGRLCHDRIMRLDVLQDPSGVQEPTHHSQRGAPLASSCTGPPVRPAWRAGASARADGEAHDASPAQDQHPEGGPRAMPGCLAPMDDAAGRGCAGQDRDHAAGDAQGATRGQQRHMSGRNLTHRGLLLPIHASTP